MAEKLLRAFVSGVVQGSNTDKGIVSQDYRQRIRKAIKKVASKIGCKLKVYDPLKAHPNSVDYNLYQAFITLGSFLKKARTADLVVVYLPEASMGCALEMYEAFKGGAYVMVITPMNKNWVCGACANVFYKTLEEFEAACEGEEVGALIEHAKGWEE